MGYLSTYSCKQKNEQHTVALNLIRLTQLLKKKRSVLNRFCLLYFFLPQKKFHRRQRKSFVKVEHTFFSYMSNIRFVKIKERQRSYKSAILHHSDPLSQGEKYKLVAEICIDASLLQEFYFFARFSKQKYSLWIIFELNF